MRYAVLVIPDPISTATVVATVSRLSEANTEARRVAVAQVEALSGVARAAQADEIPDTTGAYLVREKGECWAIRCREARVAAGWLTSSLEYDDTVHCRVLVAEITAQKTPNSSRAPPPITALFSSGSQDPLSYPFLKELETRLMKLKKD